MTQVINSNATTTIPSAERSPRIVNNVLKWYQGDTFTIDWTVSLIKDGQAYIYQPSDVIAFYFYGKNKNTPIHIFSFTNIPTTNTFTLTFDSTVSSKFTPGEYTYCIKFIETGVSTTNITTIGANNLIEVEICH